MSIINITTKIAISYFIFVDILKVKADDQRPLPPPSPVAATTDEAGGVNKLLI